MIPRAVIGLVQERYAREVQRSRVLALLGRFPSAVWGLPLDPPAFLHLLDLSQRVGAVTTSVRRHRDAAVHALRAAEQKLADFDFALVEFDVDARGPRAGSPRTVRALIRSAWRKLEADERMAVRVAEADQCRTIGVRIEAIEAYLRKRLGRPHRVVAEGLVLAVADGVPRSFDLDRDRERRKRAERRKSGGHAKQN